MARSRRKPCYYICMGANPKKGKQKTSRYLRRKVKELLHRDGEEFDFVHSLDRTRGRAGSRDWDYGWHYFGDGKKGPYTRWLRTNEKEKARLSRK